MKRLAIFAIAILSLSFHSSVQARNAWTESTWRIYSNMLQAWWEANDAKNVINECKTGAKDPRHCVTTLWFIGIAESTGGNNVTKCNNVFGIFKGCYATKDEAVRDMVERYAKHWYKRANPNDFYSNVRKRKPPTRYCMDEHSTRSKGFCPAGWKHAWEAYGTITQ